MAGKAPTVRTVAVEAGVSTATVSNVLAGREDRVSPATRDKVLAVVERLGYRPNPAARTVRTGRTQLALLSLGSLADPWTRDLTAAVTERLRPHGLHTLVLPSAEWPDVLDQQGADVVFIDDVTPDQVPALERLAARSVPTVVLSETLAPSGYDVVSSPHLPGCRLAVRHLLAGHTRIGCLAGTQHGRRGLRHGVWVDELTTAGVEVRDEWVADFEIDPHSAFRAALQLLDRADRPSAIFATTDLAGIAAIRAAQYLRLEVGTEIAVIGAGNTSEGAHTEPSLSSVGPIDYLGRLAEIVEHRLLNPSGDHHRHELVWELVLRASG